MITPRAAWNRPQATASSAWAVRPPRAPIALTAACSPGTASALLDHQPAGAPSGRASNAPPMRMPSARAVMASRRRTATGREPGAEAAPLSQRPLCGPVKRVSPSPSRSSVETRPAGTGTHTCPMRSPRSARSSRPTSRTEPLGSAERARLCSATGRRSRLVRIEQLGPGPAAQHPGELPAEVEAVVDRGVHPRAAARGHAVRGVAHEERAAAAEALRQLRGEGEAADPQDLAAAGLRRRWRAGSTAVKRSSVNSSSCRAPGSQRTP